MVLAQDAWALGLPGFQGMKLPIGTGPGRTTTRSEPGSEEYYFHFPDGDACGWSACWSAADPRVPGTTTDDVVTSRVDYAKLDDPVSPTRNRLNSRVLHVERTDGDPAGPAGSR